LAAMSYSVRGGFAEFRDHEVMYAHRFRVALAP
jgi:hypothetical protein